MRNQIVMQLGTLALLASFTVPLSAQTQTVEGNPISGHGRARWADAHPGWRRAS